MIKFTSLYIESEVGDLTSWYDLNVVAAFMALGVNMGFL